MRKRFQIANITSESINENGATEAGRRRDWAVQVEVVAARRRQAQEVSRRQGRNILRHGFGLNI